MSSKQLEGVLIDVYMVGYENGITAAFQYINKTKWLGRGACALGGAAITAGVLLTVYYVKRKKDRDLSNTFDKSGITENEPFSLGIPRDMIDKKTKGEQKWER